MDYIFFPAYKVALEKMMKAYTFMYDAYRSHCRQFKDPKLNCWKQYGFARQAYYARR